MTSWFYAFRSRAHLLDLNRRFRIARAKIYIEQGFYQLQTPIRLTIAGTVLDYWLRRMGAPLPSWFVVISILACLPTFYLVGILWTRHGWQQQEVEVPLIEGMSRLSQIEMVQRFRIMAALDVILGKVGSDQRCEFNHIPRDVPPAVIEVLSSAKQST